MATDKPRFTLTIPEETLKDIEDFRFENRYQNRTDAILELIRKGIEAVKRDQEKSDD